VNVCRFFGLTGNPRAFTPRGWGGLPPHCCGLLEPDDTTNPVVVQGALPCPGSVRNAGGWLPPVRLPADGVDGVGKKEPHYPCDSPPHPNKAHAGACASPRSGDSKDRGKRCDDQETHQQTRQKRTKKEEMLGKEREERETMTGTHHYPWW